MELSWSMKLRIAAVAAVGIILVGFIGRPSDMPSEQVGIAIGDIIVLIILAFLSGAIGYFVSWPYGRQVGVLAAPFGLTVWALRAGSMTYLLQLNPSVTQHQQLIASIQWEPILWLVIVAAGFAGVLLLHNIIPGRKIEIKQDKHSLSINGFLNGIIAIAASVLIVQICIRLLAQDVRIFDNRLGLMVAQPAVGQIMFAVLVSFGVAAFAVKKLLNVSYIWPIISIVLIVLYATTTFAKQEILDYLVQTWPVAFYPNAVICVLPVQMVAFGTLGSVAGYWMAVSYTFWRQQES